MTTWRGFCPGLRDGHARAEDASMPGASAEELISVPQNLRGTIQEESAWGLFLQDLKGTTDGSWPLVVVYPYSGSLPWRRMVRYASYRYTR